MVAKGQKQGGPGVWGRGVQDLLGSAVWVPGRTSVAPVESQQVVFQNCANHQCTSRCAKAAKEELYSLLESPAAGYKRITAEKH